MEISKRLHVSRIVSLAAFAVLATGTAVAQNPNRTGGTGLEDPVTSSIRCRVLLPTGEAAGKGIKVTLNTMRSPITMLFSDRNGEATFRYLRAGNYTVDVLADPAIFDPVTEDAVVLPGRDAIVSVYLHERILKDPKPVLGLASVDEFDGTVPSDAKKEYDHATKLAKKGDSENAIRGFERAIAIYPDYQKARNDLGVHYFRAGRTREAAEQFEIVLKLNPKAFRPHLNLGLLLVDEHDYARGIEELRRAIELNDTDPSAHLNLGIALTETGEYEAGRKELFVSLLLGQDACIVANYYVGLGYARTRDRAQALQYLNTYLASAPKGQFAVPAQKLIEELSASSR